ncbi:hypothetical protein EDC01DRAFT_590869, partial [Geopyxis carbonaria]
FSVLPALSLSGVLATAVVEGSFTMDTFQKFILHDVVPVMGVYPGPNSVLIMDNCRIHH